VIVGCYLWDTIPNPPISEIVNFYLSSREFANSVLSNGANQRPRYSLRTLVRTLEFCHGNSGIFGFRRALYEGACMSFLTLLDGNSIPIMEKLQGPTSSGMQSKILTLPSLSSFFGLPS
jgi:midasin